MTPEAKRIRYSALRMALQFGYTRDGEILRAPLGKFETEHWSTPYWYDAFMNGMDGPLSSGVSVFEPTAAEREAFEIPASQTYVALEFADAGFVSQFAMTEAQRTQYELSFEDESDFDNQD